MKHRYFDFTLVIIFVLGFLLYFSLPIINLHEQAHCLGAKIIGRQCFINFNVASVNKLIPGRAVGATLIYSGMPYIIMLLLTFLILTFRKYWINKSYNLVFYIVLALFFYEFLINLAGMLSPSSDFNHIFFIGSLMDKSIIFLAILDFFIMFLFILTIRKNQKTLKTREL